MTDDPTQGRPARGLDIRATEFDGDAPMGTHWAYAREACPTPTWTVVLIERVHPQFGTSWEAYAEPGVPDEPDAEKRLAERMGARSSEMPVSLRLLGDALRRKYQPLILLD